MILVSEVKTMEHEGSGARAEDGKNIITQWSKRTARILEESGKGSLKNWDREQEKEREKMNKEDKKSNRKQEEQ